MRILTFILIILSSSVIGQKKLYNVRFINDSAAFDSISYSEPFVIHNTGDSITNLAQFKMAWDSLHLYLGFKVEDTKLETFQTEHDSQIFITDDCVEMFLDFDGNGMNYLELGFNPKGVYYDYKIVCPPAKCGSWTSDTNLDIFVKDITTKHIETMNINGDMSYFNEYRIELIIPFSSFNSFSKYGYSLPQNTTKWSANFFNINPTNGAYNAWSPTQSFGFHQPDYFGDLIFVK